MPLTMTEKAAETRVFQRELLLVKMECCPSVLPRPPEEAAAAIQAINEMTFCHELGWYHEQALVPMGESFYC